MMKKVLHSEKITLSWSRRFPRKSVEHPRFMYQFNDWQGGDLDQVASYHNGYLRMCDKSIKERWLKEWFDVFAVGPFVERKRHHKIIPFVLVANFRQPYRHLIKLSEILAEAYQEFLILPDIHIILEDFVLELEETENSDWLKTKQYSINWTRKNINA